MTDIVSDTTVEPTRLERWDIVKRQEQFTLSENVTDFVDNMINDANRLETSIEYYKSNVKFYKSIENGVHQFKDMLIEAINQSKISDDLASEWAEHFGLELTRRIEVSARVEVTAVLNVPFDYDIDSWDDDLSLDLDFGYTAEVEESDYSIEYSEATEV